MIMASLQAAARSLGGEVSRGQVLCPGPNHSSADRSLAVRFDHRAPDGFLVSSFAGDTWQECRDYVRKRLAIRREFLDVDKIRRPANCRVDPTTDDAGRIARALAIWRETVELTSTSFEWLAKRRINLDGVPDHGGLRFHPRCPWGDSVRPCIVARFTDAVTNEPRGIWRRPLTGEKPKTLGPMAGCVIRLWLDEYVEQGLVLGEGVETTLAAATSVMHNGTLLQPAWATGGTSGLSKFPILAGMDALTILVDHDENGAGRRAAEECAKRWVSAGREVELLTPNRTGADFNDVVKERSGR